MIGGKFPIKKERHMRRKIIVPLLVFASMALATVAQAWTFTVTGNCAGWTISQNEPQSSFDYWTIDNGAQIDDSVTSFFIADTPPPDSRTFTVRWWDEKSGPDELEDTVTRTGTRVCQTTTTTQAPTTTTTGAPSTTTSVPSSSTTGQQTTTTIGTTTTSPPSTTTSIPEESTTTTVEESTTSSTSPSEPTTTAGPTTTLPFDSIPSTTVIEATTVVPPVTVSTTPGGDAELPFTGDWTLLLGLAGTVMAAGGYRLVKSSKPKHTGEEGAAMVEYAVLLVLIAVVAIVAISQVGGMVSGAFSSIAGTLAN